MTLNLKKKEITIDSKIIELSKENITKIKEKLTESYENCGLKCQIEIGTAPSPDINENILPSFLVTPPGEGQYYPKGSVFKFSITIYE